MAAVELTQVHLFGKGMSGRAVRYRLLTIDEIEHNEALIGGELTKDSPLQEYRNKVARAGLEQMIVEYTEPVTREKLAQATWTKTSAEQLNKSWSTLFKAKDTAALKAMYLDEYSLSQAELDGIMAGKVVMLPE